jgi:anaerobic ribonucleoside-triphosphate reductase
VTHDHERDEDEDAVDISAWARTAERRTCPACGAAGGALQLGGGLFCPSCGEVTTNPGYEAPPQTE